MTRTVWKYQIAAPSEQTVPMPAGAWPLAVAEQMGTVCLWAAVDPSRPTEPRTIYVVGTGHPLPDAACVYLGTVLMQGGRLVWHVFTDRAA